VLNGPRSTVQLCIWPIGENGPRPASTRTPGPAAQQPTARPPKRPAPAWAESGPRAAGCCWSSIALDRHLTAVRTHRVIKNPQRQPPQTLASFLLSPPPRLMHAISERRRVRSCRARQWLATVRGGAARHAAAASSSLLLCLCSLPSIL
jgi:hypothetical protein